MTSGLDLLENYLKNTKFVIYHPMEATKEKINQEKSEKRISFLERLKSCLKKVWELFKYTFGLSLFYQKIESYNIEFYIRRGIPTTYYSNYFQNLGHQQAYTVFSEILKLYLIWNTLEEELY